MSSRLRYALFLPLRLDAHLRRQYAYDPSHMPQQQGPSGPPQGTSYREQTRAMMPPPPPPIAQRKSQGIFPSTGPTEEGVVSSHTRHGGRRLLGDISQAPQSSPQGVNFMSNTPHLTAPLSSNRFAPRVSTSHTPSGRFVPQTPDSRRFVPAATTTGSRVHSSAGNPNPVLVHNGQRTPFFLGARMG